MSRTPDVGAAPRALAALAGRLQLLILLALPVLVGAVPAEAATTWIQGRVVNASGGFGADGTNLTMGSGAPQRSTVARGSFFVQDRLIPGSRDQLCVSLEVLGTTCTETRYISLAPATNQGVTIVPSDQIASWRTAVSVDGDGTLGAVYGVVRDAAGAPVASASVTLTPASGQFFTFDADGTPNQGGTTSASGRFLFLDTASGSFTARATVGGATAGIAYGVGVDRQTASLDVSAPLGIAGMVVDGAGQGVSGASVVWDADPSVATLAGPGGAWALADVARGLDLTVLATASGFRQASTFRTSLAETPDAGAIAVRLLDEASYTAIPAGFGEIQAPSLGMVIGRVLDAQGFPLAGAVVSVDPEVGSVGYFDASGNPSPSLTATSPTGRFVVFNLPVGDVVLSAVAPGATVRSAVAPSIAGAVAQGDLTSYQTQTVTGTVFDEQFRTAPIGGAIVQVVEFPFIAAIAASNGTFTLTGVPKNTLLSLRAAKNGFVDTYTFRRDSGPDDERTQNLFLVSELSVNALYQTQGLVFNKLQGLVSTAIRLSTVDGAAGLEGETVPSTGTPFYPGPGSSRRHPLEATSIFGNINILGVFSGETAVVAIDPRSDFISLELAPARANAATIDSLRVPCDASPSELSNIFPCEGTLVGKSSSPESFNWKGDPGTINHYQVQFSTDPLFGSIAVTSKTSQRSFLSVQHWQPSPKRWKRILALGDGGTAVYWRVMQRVKVSKNTVVDTFTTPFSFTVR